jgi:hypothetical protein
MMRRLLLSLLLLLCINAHAQRSGFGAGIMVGDPTGLAFKAWMGGDRAIAGGLAWSFVDEGYFHAHADLLFHKMDLITVGRGQLPLYFGPGLRLRTWGDGNDRNDNDGRTDIGVRFPVGLAYLFDGAPVDVFLEVVPTLDLIPRTDFDLDAAIGARYWF